MIKNILKKIKENFKILITFIIIFILFTMPFTLANGKFLTYTVVILIIFAFILSKL